MLPRPIITDPAEAFSTNWGERECDASIIDRPGVAAFRTFVREHQGGGYGSTGGRPCLSTGHPSGHYSGRAWDWSIRADVPEERQKAEELLTWLTANDAEMFRRAGLTYMIWNRKKWHPRSGGWVPYGGFAEDGSCPSGSCRHPHRDHVHFSFSKAGADGQTSFYRWVGMPHPPADPQPPAAPFEPIPGLPPAAPPSTVAALSALALGVAVGAGIVRMVPILARRIS